MYSVKPVLDKCIMAFIMVPVSNGDDQVKENLSRGRPVGIAGQDYATEEVQAFGKGS